RRDAGSSGLGLGGAATVALGVGGNARRRSVDPLAVLPGPGAHLGLLLRRRPRRPPGRLPAGRRRPACDRLAGLAPDPAALQRPVGLRVLPVAPEAGPGPGAGAATHPAKGPLPLPAAGPG